MPFRPLSKELQEVAGKELNEVPSRVQADLDHLREWISQQPHLKARTDDQWLLSFLRGSKFSLQNTKKKLDLYYTVRKLVPEVHTDKDPLLPEVQEVLKRGTILVLPKTANSTASTVFFFRLSTLDSDKIRLNTMYKVLVMIMEILMIEDDNFVVVGGSYITDYRGFPYEYIAEATPTFVKKLVMSVHNVYPTRFKEFHYFSTPSVVTTAYNIIKMFVPEKLTKRVFFYKDDLLQNTNAIPESVLPREYWGEGVSCNKLTAYWKEKVESYRDWFLDDAQYGADETKRLGTSKYSNETFGVEGSFIKLEID